MEAVDQGSSLKSLTLFNALPYQRTTHLNLRALVKLERVRLKKCYFHQQDLADLFGALSPSTRLRKLSLYDGPLLDLELLNLAPPVHLEKVTLRVKNFLFYQKMVDFFAILSAETKLKKMSIGYWRTVWGCPAVDMMDGSTEVMATGINFLEKVDLSAVHPYQVSNQ